MFEKSWEAILHVSVIFTFQEKNYFVSACILFIRVGRVVIIHFFAIVAVIGAVVKQKIAPDAPYGIDSRHYFEVISLFPEVQECRRAAVPF